MGLITELKRRNVFRMAVLYIVAAWLVMQVAEVLIGLGVLPERSGFWVFVALAVGFPIALVVSWLFEVTPEGVILEKDVPEGPSITHVTGRRMDFVIIGILSAGLLLFALDKWWETGPEDLSIAVLPFENMSADAEQEYFSDGISEEILNLLAQIRPLKVTARTSSFWFKGKDVKIADIAAELNVRHVLEGSVRRSGDRVRITAQLIDAEDSSHLWSQTYDRDYSAANLFFVQSEIARAITDRLRMTLTGDDEERLAKVPTENTEAYAAYLLGRQRLRDRKVDDLADAVEQFALAIELDPEFAGAYSGLTDACVLFTGFSGGHSNEHCPSSAADREQLLRKTLELDPQSGEVWISLGLALWNQSGGPAEEGIPKLRGAIAAYERGLELNPNLSQGYHWYGMALMAIPLHPHPPSGWIEAWKAGVWESVYDKGLEVDPLYVQLHEMKAIYPAVSKSKEEAIWHGHRMVEIAPDSPKGYETLGEQVWDLNGRIDESIRWKSKALAIDPKHPLYAAAIGRAYSALGDPDMALAYYDLAKANIAPDNKFRQDGALVSQAMVRLAAGRENASQIGELQALLNEPRNFIELGLGIYADLATGRPADALTMFEEFLPRCLPVNYIEEMNVNCPTELIRVYQELGDLTSARDVIDGMIREAKLWVDGFPGDEIRLEYARVLAAAGQKDRALDVLEDLVSSGWRGDHRSFLRFTLCCDVTFDAVRDDERFQAIVATIEADMAQQLENVRAMERNGEIPTLEEVQALIAAKQESG